MITRNHTINVYYENLLVSVEIARVLYISMMSCERVFSVQNCIKTKHKKMLTTFLESVLRIALEGPIEDCHEIFNEAIAIWKKNQIQVLFLSFKTIFMWKCWF